MRSHSHKRSVAAYRRWKGGQGNGRLSSDLVMLKSVQAFPSSLNNRCHILIGQNEMTRQPWSPLYSHQNTDNKQTNKLSRSISEIYCASAWMSETPSQERDKTFPDRHYSGATIDSTSRKSQFMTVATLHWNYLSFPYLLHAFFFFSFPSVPLPKPLPWARWQRTPSTMKSKGLDLLLSHPYTSCF